MKFFEIALLNPIGAALITGVLLIALSILLKGWVRLLVFARVAFSFARSLFPRFGTWFFVKWFLLSCVVFVFRHPIADLTGFAVQYYINPVNFQYYDQDTCSATEQAFLRKLRRNVSQREFDTLMASTSRMAARHGCGTLQFLEVYESECGLNPFAVNVNSNGDTVAAGHIQFTRAGVDGLQVDGQSVTMWRVKKAIMERDIVYLCKAGEAYMLRASNGQRLRRSCDVYTAVFLPYFVGMPDHTVVASKDGKKPEWYFQNIGLDGYGISSGKVIKANRYLDGRITIQDLALRLAHKKAAVVREFGF